MLSVWGIYLEDNPNKVNQSNCRNRERLRSSTAWMLETIDPQKVSHDLTAPRCRESAVQSTKQGPLRCSLARLAWEQCFESWNDAASSFIETRPEQSDELFQGLGNAQAHVDAIDRSAIHAVDPASLL
eukprot:gnl/TRDRNA2_/TRDRNA2_123000_c0_seq1.p1 gnl/TRDRNA2_/TRDRNA2_123000_c0~~gnl/TRDRNA2_/TRDRNA2_123000_c0_seq1.p1  ORF type:complete len:128 (-),score=16.72 gnl/TRDRNA2_/TRDRNA2_123000_c0_seq1:32-415(-)